MREPKGNLYEGGRGVSLCSTARKGNSCPADALMSSTFVLVLLKAFFVLSVFIAAFGRIYGLLDFK